MDTIREILAAHESGISRDGLLAWARLRADPTMTDAQLEAALVALGDEVVDVQGFLYLRRHAPASALGDAGAFATPPPPPVEGQAWGAPPPPVEGQAWGAPDGSLSPPSSPGGRRTMVLATVGVLGFVVAAGIGAFILRAGDRGAALESPPVDATPAEETPAVPTPTSGSVVDAFTIELGDCLIVPSEDQFEEIRRLACTEPHDGEVFFVADYPGSDLPSDDDFSTFVEEQCLPAFAEFTGSPYEDQDVLDVGWFTPTEGSWGNGDREVVCYLTPVDGSQTSQSYHDAKP